MDYTGLWTDPQMAKVTSWLSDYVLKIAPFPVSHAGNKTANWSPVPHADQPT